MHKEDSEMNGSSSSSSGSTKIPNKVSDNSIDNNKEHEKSKNQDFLKNAENFYKYSRSKLYAIRNLQKSQDRPVFKLRNNLQVLGVWKSVSTTEVTTAAEDQNSCCEVDEYLQEKTLSECGSYQGPSSININKRTIRSRERLVNYYRDKEVIKPGVGGEQNQNVSTPSSHNVSTQGTVHKSILMDQRSASSSHLLPAFAKRQMVTTHSEPSNIESNCNIALAKNNAHQFENSFSANKSMNKERNYFRATDDTSAHNRNENSNDFGDRVHLNNQETSGTFNSNPRNSNFSYERRIGSGRLPPRDINWDYRNQECDKEKYFDRDTASSVPQKIPTRLADRSQPGRNANSRFVDKRNFNRRNVIVRRDFEKNERGHHNDEDAGMYHNSESNHYRRQNVRNMKSNYRDDKRDEPEWFLEGPKSQHDTIELRGFEENSSCDANDSKSLSEHAAGQEVEKENLRSDENSNSDNSSEHRQITEEDAHSPISEYAERNTSPGIEQSIDSEKSKREQSSTAGKDFNFDAFLNFDTINNPIIQLDAENSGLISLTNGSRFSRLFFKNDASKNTPVQEKSEINSEKELTKHEDHFIPLSEFLLNNKSSQIAVKGVNNIKQEILSVAELEAKMRKSNMNETFKHSKSQSPMQNVETSYHTEKNSQQEEEKHSPREDMEAFKRLLLQAQSKVCQSEEVKHSQLKVPIIPTDSKKPVLTVKSDQPENFQRVYNVQSSFPMIPNFGQIEPTIRQPAPFFPIRDGLIPPSILHAEQQRQSEFIKLLQALQSGEVSVGLLQNELMNPNAPQHLKDVIFAVLRENAMRTTIFNNAPDGQPILNQLPIQPTPQHLLLPLPPQIGAVSKVINMEANAAYHGAVTPHSFQQHKHLNEALNPTNHQSEHSNRHLPSPSPTPLAFTPTSVLRKMTAEKDTTIGSQSEPSPQLEPFKNKHQPEFQQPICLEANPLPALPSQHPPRMILGNGPPSATAGNQFPPINNNIPPQQSMPLHLQPLPQRWPLPHGNQPIFVNRPLGRPILKGPTPTAQQQTLPYPTIQQNIFQQNDQQKSKADGGNPPFLHMQAQLNQQQSQPVNLIQQQHQNIMCLQNHQNEIHLQEKEYHCMNSNLRNNMNIMHDAEGNRSGIVDIASFPRSTNLSPTSNQLAQWFSPELLAQATAGKLPSLNLTQALSLEEFEKQQHSSTTVHS